MEDGSDGSHAHVIQTYKLKDGWTRVTDGGFLTDLPSYEKDGYYVAQDYDDLDSPSQKLMWFVHDDSGFLAAFPTLAEAKKFCA